LPVKKLFFRWWDITNRKLAEESLRKSAEELKVANLKLTRVREELNVLNRGLEEKVQNRTQEINKLLKQKDDFISQLGHDLKNPLTPLVALLPTLLSKTQDPESKQLLEVMQQNINHMKNLVLKTLQLSKLNSEKIRFDFINLNLSEEIKKAISKNGPLFEKNNIIVKNKIIDYIIVKADRLRLEELMDNFLNNASKFIQKSNGLIVIDTKKEGDFVIVSIKDNGIGMTKDHIAGIFTEFYKVDPSRHELGSSGLGLSINKRIIERHGGKIWAESRGLGYGSTFYFTLKCGDTGGDCNG
jgi:signal transduction histidine kinase